MKLRWAFEFGIKAVLKQSIVAYDVGRDDKE
jgi:hypothetical protein